MVLRAICEFIRCARPACTALSEDVVRHSGKTKVPEISLGCDFPYHVFLHRNVFTCLEIIETLIDTREQNLKFSLWTFNCLHHEIVNLMSNPDVK